jgi:hypothetical protein
LCRTTLPIQGTLHSPSQSEQLLLLFILIKARSVCVFLCVGVCVGVCGGGGGRGCLSVCVSVRVCMWVCLCVCAVQMSRLFPSDYIQVTLLRTFRMFFYLMVGACNLFQCLSEWFPVA